MNLTVPAPPSEAVSASGPPTVDVVIVNWNAGTQLTDCLQALHKCDKSGFTLGQVIVIDNASTDGSADAAQRLVLGVPLTMVRNALNSGFAAA